MLYGNNSSYMVNVCMLILCVVEIMSDLLRLTASDYTDGIFVPFCKYQGKCMSCHRHKASTIYTDLHRKNGQNKKDKRNNNDLQNTTQKT
jgi:hypothetical protein